MARNHEFATDALSVLLGSGVGVVVDKVVGDALLATNIPNPQWETIQTHDVLLVVAELLGAYAVRNKSKEASNFLIGMAGAIIATDVYEKVAASGRWLKASAVANSNYAGPVTPKASGIAPPAAPETELIVGNYGGGGGKVVYANADNTAPACAGENANNPQLFI